RRRGRKGACMKVSDHVWLLHEDTVFFETRGDDESSDNHAIVGRLKMEDQTRLLGRVPCRSLERNGSTRRASACDIRAIPLTRVEGDAKLDVLASRGGEHGIGLGRVRLP